MILASRIVMKYENITAGIRNHKLIFKSKSKAHDPAIARINNTTSVSGK
jgi:hypothetical protein